MNSFIDNSGDSFNQEQIPKKTKTNNELGLKIFLSSSILTSFNYVTRFFIYSSNKPLGLLHFRGGSTTEQLKSWRALTYEVSLNVTSPDLNVAV